MPPISTASVPLTFKDNVLSIPQIATYSEGHWDQQLGK